MSPEIKNPFSIPKIPLGKLLRILESGYERAKRTVLLQRLGELTILNFSDTRNSYSVTACDDPNCQKTATIRHDGNKDVPVEGTAKQCDCAKED